MRSRLVEGPLCLFTLIIINMILNSQITEAGPFANFLRRGEGSSGQDEYTLLSSPKHSVILRAPRNIGNFFRRMLGKGDRSQPQIPASLAAAYAPVPSSSAYYPTYAPALFIPQPGAIPSSPNPSYSMAASMASPAYASASQGVPTASSAQSPDFHAVLDSFVRSTGLAPQGSLPPDQEAAASSLSQPGVIPAFSWKRLYSFPFYFSTDSAASGSGSRINIPYMKQHIRRTSDHPLIGPSLPPAMYAAYPQIHEHSHHPYGGLYDLQEAQSVAQYQMLKPEMLKNAMYNSYKEQQQQQSQSAQQQQADYMTSEASSKHPIVMDVVKEANLKALNTLRAAQEQTKILQAEVERSKEAVASSVSSSSSDATPATIYRYYSPSTEFQMKQQEESI